MAPLRGRVPLLLVLAAVASRPQPVHEDQSRAKAIHRAEAVVALAPPTTVTSTRPKGLSTAPTRQVAPRASRARAVGRTPAPGAAGAVEIAAAQLGKPYHWGAAGPSSYDCSGLTMYAWAAVGRQLPHSSYRQWDTLPHVPLSALQPGDLIFFNRGGHVGIYVGGGRMIHAPHRGDVVRYADIRGAIGAARP